jgi:hypothetical protein
MAWIGLILFLAGVAYGWVASNVWVKLVSAFIVGGIGWYMTMTALGMSKSSAAFMALAWAFIFWFVDATVPTLTSADTAGK